MEGSKLLEEIIRVAFVQLLGMRIGRAPERKIL